MHPSIRRLAPWLAGIIGLSVLCVFSLAGKSPQTLPDGGKSPHIVNIINFIRLCEPRDPKITEEVLYETVVKQIDLMRKYRLKGTFLLQYDALSDPRYQKLLKTLPSDSFEIGAWWEMPQPLVEDAGLKWRGDAPWDPRADVDFSTGYSPSERAKLADTYMKKFKEVFGYYPKSVGSWFMDAYTLDYLYKNYNIVASCNCKDQIGTDGYTLWGGYWNQAYYPSLKNAYMPAQHAGNQIPVPIFRMLGSDPIHQYDNGIGSERQGVTTLEPVYKFGGGDSAWVYWYFRQFTQGEPLAYAYVQVGQENSFTWDAMARGLKIQLPLIARLRDEQQLQVETLGTSGKWFRDHYTVTPPTAVTVNQGLGGKDVKTVWFDSRFYRVNLLWENGSLRIRDIHLFNENMVSPYLTQKSTSRKSSFFTLPFFDGNRWSSREKTAALRFKGMINNQESVLRGGDPVIEKRHPGALHITWPLTSMKGTLIIDINERQISIKMKDHNPGIWFLELSAAPSADLPFQAIHAHEVKCLFNGMNYSIRSTSGTFSAPSDSAALKIVPQGNELTLDLAAGKD